MNKHNLKLPIKSVIISLIFFKIIFSGSIALAEEAQTQAQFKAVLQQYIQDHDVDTARQGFLQIIQSDPTFSSAFYNLARLAEIEEDWESAIDWYRQYLRLSPDTEAAGRAKIRLIALEKLQQNDADPAKRQARKYEEALMLAQALLGQGDIQGAFRQAEKATAIDENRFEGFLLAGTIFVTQRQCDQAQLFLSLALKRAQSDKDRKLIQTAQSNCENELRFQELMQEADNISKAKNFKKAARTYEEAWQLPPQYDEAGLAAAVHYSLNKDFKKSRAIFEKLANSRSPTIAIEARRNLRYLKTLMLPKVESDIPGQNSQSIEKMPGGESYLKAVALMKKNRLEAAETLLDAAIDSIPFHSEYGYYFYRRGELRYKQRKFKEAINDLRMAILLMPGLADAYALLGQSYFSEKAYQETIDTCSRGLFFAADQAVDLYYFRGKAWYARGNHPHALNDIKKYLKTASRQSPHIRKARILRDKIDTAYALEKASQSQYERSGGYTEASQTTSEQGQSSKLSKRKKSKKEKKATDWFEQALDDFEE